MSQVQNLFETELPMLTFCFRHEAQALILREIRGISPCGEANSPAPGTAPLELLWTSTGDRIVPDPGARCGRSSRPASDPSLFVIGLRSEDILIWVGICDQAGPTAISPSRTTKPRVTQCGELPRSSIDDGAEMNAGPTVAESKMIIPHLEIGLRSDGRRASHRLATSLVHLQRHHTSTETLISIPRYIIAPRSPPFETIQMASPELPVLDLAQTLARLPPPPSSDLKRQTRAALADPSSPVPILVALDDDPTGTQTCNTVAVLTTWPTDVLEAELRRTPAGGGFFILTNSRSLGPEAAEALLAEICTNLKAASGATGIPVEVVLRGDSTLRGHFPLEVDVAEKIMGEADACLLCPFFLQGGRYTIDDVHYVAEGDKLVPAAQTPFARDATFGYRSSNLRDYVEEKTGGRVKRDAVELLSLDLIRKGGADAVLKHLLSVPKGSVVIVNATTDEDVDIVVLAVLKAAAEGKRYVYRTGAAFVSARLGIAQIPPISPRQLDLNPGAGGLVIAGSYVPKTTAQLAVLRESSGDRLTTIEIQVEDLLRGAESSAKTIREAIHTAEREICRGQDVLVMTSRKLVVGTDAGKSLEIGSVVAHALVEFLVNLKTKPRYIIAKGGITSSDMATKGLRMKRAMILGQAGAGIPLWRCDEESSKWAGIPYVVFPGNVGAEDALFKLVDSWRDGE